jgi:hypothetical protein
MSEETKENTQPQPSQPSASNPPRSPLAARLIQGEPTTTAPETKTEPGKPKDLPFKSDPVATENDTEENESLTEDELNTIVEIAVESLEGFNTNVLPYFAERSMFSKISPALLQATQVKLLEYQKQVGESKEVTIKFSPEEEEAVARYTELHKIKEAMPMAPQQKQRLEKFLKKVVNKMGWNIKLPLWAEALWVIGSIEIPKALIIWKAVNK